MESERKYTGCGELYKKSSWFFFLHLFKLFGKIPLIELSVCSSIDCFFSAFISAETKAIVGSEVVHCVFGYCGTCIQISVGAVIFRPSTHERTVCGTYNFNFVFVVTFFCLSVRKFVDHFHFHFT